MPIAIGDRIPEVTLALCSAAGMRPVTTSEYFAGRRVALFAVPGAFTPTCSDTHLPGFLARADDLRRLGIDEIACTAVNDAHVMRAWAQATGAAENLSMLADGSGNLARELGLELDGRGFGMGMRSLRYAAVLDDGVFVYLAVEPGRGVDVSGAEAMVAWLRANAKG